MQPNNPAADQLTCPVDQGDTDHEYAELRVTDLDHTGLATSK